MNLKQTLKALFIGFVFGFCLTWVLALLLPLLMNADCTQFIHDCAGDILSISWMTALFSSLVCLLLTATNQKKKRREELENEMLDYFRRQKEKENLE